MEKSYLLLVAVLIFGTAKAQIPQDSVMNEPIVINEEVVGNLDQMLNGRNSAGQPTLTFNVSLFRDVTKEEEKAITRKYNPIGSENRTVNFSYDYGFSSNQEWAGHLLYESGKLKTQAANIMLSSVLVAVSGNIIYRRMALNLNENYKVPLRVSIPISTVSALVATVKGYKANRKMREAGILLQKK